MSDRSQRGRAVQSKNKSSNVTLYAILGIVAVLGLSAIAFLALNNGAGSASTSATPAGGIPDAPTLPIGRTDDGLYYIGKADAPVVVTEFADYQWPGCGYFARVASPTFERDYIETGKVKLVFSEFPLQGHINAVPAAEAARCAGVQNQNAFWQMHDILFNNQSLWGADQNPQTRFEGYATQLKLDSAAFKACISNGEQSAAVAKARDAGIQMNVQGTPAFAVNGKLVDTTAAQSVDDIVAAMRQQVDAALAGK